MEKDLNNLRKAMDSSTHKGIHFTESHKEKIRAAVYRENLAVKKKPKLSIYLITTLAASLFVLLFYPNIIDNLSINRNNIQGTNQSLANEWEVRYNYSRNGKLLFSVFPDPNLYAGKTFGYMISFKEPFEKYEGKKLEIFAIHKETGERVKVLPSTKITEPSPGYSSLGRFTTRLLIPNGGLWKYEFYFNNKLYGDVVLELRDEDTLPVNIPNFVQQRDFEKIDWNRSAVNLGNNIMGNENKSGVIGADKPSVGINQKWMWLLWGIENPKETKVTIVGFHRETKTAHQILTAGWTIGLGGENKGADAHSPSSVNLPLSGEWAIILYVDGKIFDILVYNITH